MRCIVRLLRVLLAISVTAAPGCGRLFSLSSSRASRTSDRWTAGSLHAVTTKRQESTNRHRRRRTWKWLESRLVRFCGTCLEFAPLLSSSGSWRKSCLGSARVFLAKPSHEEPDDDGNSAQCGAPRNRRAGDL